VGLLDDAIREHLELKRRNGASDEELARKEAEALGPARRDFPAPVAEHEEREEHEEPDHELESVDPAPPPEPQPPTEEYLIEDEEEPAPHGDEPFLEEAEPPAEPEPPSRESEDEDVLEDTPEFLQETPEHDRLWFEQKPPRDFDFE
jgi:hypothetical protein